ncbi:MAG: winged helix-turn-helix domain-containing protein [Actinobacteria bacterium]|nr:winged helix-turn-helix domain-containing protein [Actinomycetota bacterium]
MTGSASPINASAGQKNKGSRGGPKMAIPAFQDLMLPLLIFASDGQEHTPRETVETLADEFSLAEADRQELLPSGRQATFDNRVAWAKAHMKMAGPLSSPKRGIYRITDRGQETVNRSYYTATNVRLSSA